MTTTYDTALISPEMAARLTGAASAWEEIAFASGPTDRAAAEAGVRSAYRAVGLAEPGHIVWLPSPAHGAVAAALLTGGAAAREALASGGLGRAADEVMGRFSGVGGAGPSVRELVRTAPWERARAEAVATLGVHAWPHAWEFTGARLWAGVHRLVNDIRTGIATSAGTIGTLVTGNHEAPAVADDDTAVGVAVAGNDTAVRVAIADNDTAAGVTVADNDTAVRVAVTDDAMAVTDDNVPAAVADGNGAAGTTGAAGAGGDGAAVDDHDVAQAAALLRQATLDAVFGQQDAPWLSLFEGLGGGASLDGLMRVARAAGWWWPFERVAVLCERPVSMHRDDLGRLHRATGPALAFGDGFGLYAWHGMPVPADFGAAMADLTPERIRQEENAELRRVMLEHFGFDRYLTESAATPIQRDAAGVLWRLELPDDEPLAMVEVVNSTPEPDGTSRTYFLRVPPWTRTAREGVAWTFGLAEGDYLPERET